MKNNNVSQAPEDREADWNRGYHTSSSGKQQLLSDLPTTYLKNIINKYGADYDVSKVQAEYDSRPEEQ